MKKINTRLQAAKFAAAFLILFVTAACKINEESVTDCEIYLNGQGFNKTAFVEVIPKGKTATIPDDNNCTFIGDVFWEKDEDNKRIITLDYFSMSKYEVTQELYQAVMGQLPFSDEENCYEDEKQKLRPASGMNWYDAVFFCNELSTLCGYEPVYEISNISYKNSTENTKYIKAATVTWDSSDLTKNGFRLPTEAEWEYAARGAGKTAQDWTYTYSGSDNSKKVSWTNMNSSGYSDEDDTLRTHEVGLKKPNAAGIYDMSGNVAEWCADYFRSVTEDGDFNHGNGVKGFGELRNPCMEKGSYDTRAVRGGSYDQSTGYAANNQRTSVGATECTGYDNKNFIGIRLVRRP